MSYYFMERIVNRLLREFSDSRESMVYNSVLVELSNKTGLYFLYHESVNMLEIYVVNPKNEYDAGTIPFPHYTCLHFNFTNNLTYYQDYKGES